MNRDMDLVRKILLAVEAKEDAFTPAEELNVSGYSAEQSAYHRCLLEEAGLIEGVQFNGPAGREVVRVRLTWAGHEFLDLAREGSIWQEAKTRLGKVGVSANLSVLKELLTHLTRKALGLS